MKSAFPARQQTLKKFRFDRINRINSILFSYFCLPACAISRTAFQLADIRWARILKPCGRLYIGDILVARAIPPEALDDISLWTG